MLLSNEIRLPYSSGEIRETHGQGNQEDFPTPSTWTGANYPEVVVLSLKQEEFMNHWIIRYEGRFIMAFQGKDRFEVAKATYMRLKWGQYPQEPPAAYGFSMEVWDA